LEPGDLLTIIKDQIFGQI